MFDQCLDHLVLPAAQQALLAKSGATLPHNSDQRRFVRRFVATRAMLERGTSLPGMPRKPERHLVTVLDFSRGGMGFFHSEQLFPCERAVLSLSPEKQLPIEVAWCQKIAEKCYHIGAKFTQLPKSGENTSGGAT